MSNLASEYFLVLKRFFHINNNAWFCFLKASNTTTDLQFKLDGLHPDTIYTINVTCKPLSHTNDPEGFWSNVSTIKVNTKVDGQCS